MLNMLNENDKHGESFDFCHSLISRRQNEPVLKWWLLPSVSHKTMRTSKSDIKHLPDFVHHHMYVCFDKKTDLVATVCFRLTMF